MTMTSCKECGKKISTLALSCPNCGAQRVASGSGRQVNWVLCLLMSIFFGQLGVDRFIMGKVGTGLLKLFTFAGFGIWWLIDVILIASKHKFSNVEWV